MLPDSKTREMMFAGRIHPAGWFFIRWSIFLTVLCTLLSYHVLVIGTLVTLFIAYFFRDPERICAPVKGSVVSPADGIITSISLVEKPAHLELAEGMYHKITIFLNIWDVHVNRLPISGEIIQRTYQQGSFVHAASPEAGEKNERLSLVIRGDMDVACIQIAGFVARRILCDVYPGDSVEKGNSYGIIRFGSCMECYVPSSCQLMVTEKQRMVGGETILAIRS